ncbi:MAG: CARDB domain-containing protein [Candidatus Paceibacterota bacterium]
MNTRTHFFIKFLLLSALGISTLQWSFAGAPKTVAQGSPATINWNVVGGSGTCNPDTNYIQTTPDDGVLTAWLNQGQKSGTNSQTFPSILGAGSYTFSCTDRTAPYASDSVTLNVVAPPTNLSATCDTNNVITINGTGSSLSPATYPIRVDDAANAWQYAGTCNGYIGGGDYCSDTGTGFPQTVNGAAGHSYGIWAHTTYDNVGSPATQPINVTCAAPTAPTVTLSPFDPATISVGQNSIIQFSSTNATACTGTGLWSGDLGGTNTPVGGKSTSLLYPSGMSAGTYTQTVTCTGPGGSATSQTQTLTVNTIAAPDLVADVTSPTSAAAGTMVILSARITNSGNASTGSSPFNNFIQVATAANGGGTITDLTPVSMSALSGGAFSDTTQSYTFPSPGTYSVRACADKTDRNTTTTTDSVNESNETNNCSASWTTVTVSGVSNCTLPWGGTLASGSSVTAYQTSSVTSPATCSSETRTCNNGALSGSNQYQTCNVAGTLRSCPAISKTWLTNCSGTTVEKNNGYSTTVTNTAPGYSGTAAFSCSDGDWFLDTASASCIYSPSPAATITVPSCTITAASSTCTTSVSWTSSNLTSSLSVRQNGTQFSTLSFSTGVNRTLSHGSGASNNFTAVHTTATPSTLDTKTGTASCAGGLTWNGSTCVGEADLIAGNVSPISATVNTATMLSATITNQGLTSTGVSFNNFIQVATAANGGGTITDLTATTMGTLAAGANNTTSKSYTFPSSGTYSVRACADKTDRNTTTTTDSVNESNETNNCSASWTTITVGIAAVCSPTHYACTTGTSGNNASNSNTYDWTCTLDASTVSCSEIKGLSIVVSPTTYNTTLPTNAISATYTLTNGSSANTTCTLLDYNKQPLGGVSACTGSMSVAAPSVAGSYDYYIRAYKGNVNQTATSSVFTVVVNSGVCGNGANNYPTCTICTLPLQWDTTSSSCVDKPTVGGPTVTIDTTPPIADTLDFTCSIGSTNYEIIKSENPGAGVVASGSWAGTPIAWPITTGYGNYQVKCYTGTIVSDPGTVTYSSQAAGATTFTANPTTAKSGAVTTLVWSIATPTQTPACRIVATAVCTGGTCTSPRDDTRTANATALTTSLANGNTDNNDPYGAGRLMSLALSQPTTKASGKKTIILQYTTDFSLICPNKTQKVRVHVSNDNEG